VRFLGLGTGLSLLAIAATTSCGSPVSLPCSQSAAAAAIAQTKPRLNVGEKLVVAPDRFRPCRARWRGHDRAAKRQRMLLDRAAG